VLGERFREIYSFNYRFNKHSMSSIESTLVLPKNSARKAKTDAKNKLSKYSFSSGSDDDSNSDSSYETESPLSDSETYGAIEVESRKPDEIVPLAKPVSFVKLCGNALSQHTNFLSEFCLIILKKIIKNNQPIMK
jgi:hypothetical protein